MGLFDLFKKKDNGVALGAPMKGKCVSIREVPDPTFGEEILGKGIAIIPSDGRVYAPADGGDQHGIPDGHAVGMTAAGAELLIHIGLDTVELNGAPFTIKVSADQTVKKGRSPDRGGSGKDPGGGQKYHHADGDLQFRRLVRNRVFSREGSGSRRTK